MPTTVFGVRDWLESKRLLIDDRDAGLIGATLIKSAMKLIDNKRASDWSDEKSREVEEELEDFRGHPETTFVFVLISHLLGKTRMVPKDKVMTAEDVTEATEWIERAWRKDNICPRMNYDFDKNCIPNIRTGDKHLDAMIDEIPRLETPRPDVIWALRKEAFSVKHRHILKNQNCALAGPGLFDVFLVLEAKCMNASLEEAENQCMRSGSAIVATRRRLQAAAAACEPKGVTAASTTQKGQNLAAPTPEQDAAAACEPKVVTAASTTQKGQSIAASTTEKTQTVVNEKNASSQQSYPRPDMRSFAFSLAVGPEDARLFVNWAMELNPEGGVDWHMHHLRKFDFRSPPSLTQLHHDMDNILDWGAEKGTRRVTELCTTLEEHEAIVPQPPSKKRKIQA